jgi:hypothetical protein
VHYAAHGKSVPETGEPAKKGGRIVSGPEVLGNGGVSSREDEVTLPQQGKEKVNAILRMMGKWPERVQF